MHHQETSFTEFTYSARAVISGVTLLVALVIGFFAITGWIGAVCVGAFSLFAAVMAHVGRRQRRRRSDGHSA